MNRLNAYRLPILLGIAILLCVALLLSLGGSRRTAPESDPPAGGTALPAMHEKAENYSRRAAKSADAKKAEEEEKEAEENYGNMIRTSEEIREALNIREDYRDSFVHGEKGAAHQKYIVLHDTEGGGPASSIIHYWDSSGEGVAAHFIVDRDGTVTQAVPLDKIAHHAGFGDTGHNALYGVTDESRDDKVGTVPIGDDFADYGMNSHSVGIEMVHQSGQDYPQAQLAALDELIAYIDAYYGFTTPIIDHKSWRSGNSDTSPEFAGYLENYQDHRSYR